MAPDVREQRHSFLSENLFRGLSSEHEDIRKPGLIQLLQILNLRIDVWTCSHLIVCDGFCLRRLFVVVGVAALSAFRDAFAAAEKAFTRLFAVGLLVALCAHTTDLGV